MATNNSTQSHDDLVHQITKLKEDNLTLRRLLHDAHGRWASTRETTELCARSFMTLLIWFVVILGLAVGGYFALTVPVKNYFASIASIAIWFGFMSYKLRSSIHKWDTEKEAIASIAKLRELEGELS
jgi:hypothetical protein